MGEVTDKRGVEINEGDMILHIAYSPNVFPHQHMIINEVLRIKDGWLSLGNGGNIDTKDCLVLPTVEINGKVWCTDASLMPNDLVCLVNMVMTDKHIHTDMGFKKGKRFYGKNSGCDIKYIDTWWPADPQMPEIGQ